VLHRPQLAAGVERRRLDIAMAERPDLRQRGGAADERIVVRHRPVRVDAHDLAERRREILRAVAKA
jgi:hypothetical protein